jgi:hypothetical protein
MPWSFRGLEVVDTLDDFIMEKGSSSSSSDEGSSAFEIMRRLRSAEMEESLYLDCQKGAEQ